MTLIRLSTYVLLQCIFPVVAEYSAHGQNRSLGFALWSAFAMTAAMCLYGLAAGGREFRATWTKIWSAPPPERRSRRSWFAVLNILTVLSCLSAVFAFQGGIGAGSEGSGTVANIVDTVGALVFGLLVTFFAEASGWPTRTGLIRVVFVIAACALCVLFIVLKDADEKLDWSLLGQPVVWLAVGWALFGTLNMQIVRSVFLKRAGIDRSEFLFFRFAGPCVATGVTLAAVTAWRGGDIGLTTANWRDTLLGIFAVSTAYVYVVALQLELLRERTVAALNAADLAIPGVTYLIALVIGLAGPRTDPLSLCVTAFVIAALYIAEVLPDRRLPSLGATIRAMTVEVWGRLATEPTIRIARWLLWANVRGLALALVVFAPIVVDSLWFKSESPDRDLQLILDKGYRGWFAALFVAMFQLLALTLLARRVREIVRDEVVMRFCWDTIARAHLFKRLFRDTIVAAVRSRSPATTPAEQGDHLLRIQAGAKFGINVCTEMVDAAETLLDDAPPRLELSHGPTAVAADLQRQFELLLQIVRIGGAAVEFDFSAIPSGTRWTVDDNRLFMVWHNLVMNSLDAWHRHHRTRDYTGLRVTVRGSIDSSEAASWVTLVVADNGPGSPATPDNALDALMASSTPGSHGLGLRISQLYVEAHRGTLASTIRNPSTPGGPPGFCVTLRLPTAAEPTR